MLAVGLSCAHAPDARPRTASIAPLQPRGVTALFAGIVSLTQTDIKRTLAYSTISQLGFMTLLCGVGAFVACACGSWPAGENRRSLRDNELSL